MPFLRHHHQHRYGSPDKASKALLQKREWELHNSPSSTANLASLKLLEIPKELFAIIKMRQKRCLDASCNNLTTAADALDTLTDLETLLVHDCQLTVFPALPSLTRLRVVDLSGNQLVSLPDDWGTHVVKLVLARNKLDVVPNVVTTSMLQLVHLDLRDNLIEELPRSLGRLSHLTELLVIDGNIKLRFPPRDTLAQGVAATLAFLGASLTTKSKTVATTTTVTATTTPHDTLIAIRQEEARRIEEATQRNAREREEQQRTHQLLQEHDRSHAAQQQALAASQRERDAHNAVAETLATQARLAHAATETLTAHEEERTAQLSHIQSQMRTDALALESINSANAQTRLESALESTDLRDGAEARQLILTSQAEAAVEHQLFYARMKRERERRDAILEGERRGYEERMECAVAQQRLLENEQKERIGKTLDETDHIHSQNVDQLSENESQLRNQFRLWTFSQDCEREKIILEIGEICEKQKKVNQELSVAKEEMKREREKELSGEIANLTQLLSLALTRKEERETQITQLLNAKSVEAERAEIARWKERYERLMAEMPPSLRGSTFK